MVSQQPQETDAPEETAALSTTCTGTSDGGVQPTPNAVEEVQANNTSSLMSAPAPVHTSLGFSPFGTATQLGLDPVNNSPVDGSTSLLKPKDEESSTLQINNNNNTITDEADDQKPPAAETKETPTTSKMQEETVATDVRKEPGYWATMDLRSHLYLSIDRNCQMHRLAALYFKSRHFWFLFFPSMVITMLSGILAFMIKSDLPLTEATRSIFALIVGSVSVVNVFVQNMNNELNFDHRSKSHNSVAVGLKNILDHFGFLDLGANFDASVSELKELEKEMDTVLKVNDSNLPSEIVAAYDLASTRLGFKLMPPIKVEFSDKDRKSKVYWVNLMGTVNNEIFSVFLNYRSWPLFMPKPEYVVVTALVKIRESLLDEHQSSTPQEMEAMSRLPLYKLLLKQQDAILDANIWMKQLTKETKQMNDQPLLCAATSGDNGHNNVDNLEAGERTPLIIT